MPIAFSQRSFDWIAWARPQAAVATCACAARAAQVDEEVDIRANTTILLGHPQALVVDHVEDDAGRAGG